MYDANHLISRLRAASITHETRNFATFPARASITFGELFAGAERNAAALVGMGVKPGDRVAVQVEKTIEAIQLYLGTVMAGGVFLPLNTAYTTPEVAYFLGDARPRVLVCDPAREDDIAEVAGDARVVTLDGKGLGSLPDAVVGRGGFDPVPRGPDDLAAILYTSGTTGRSKGAMLSHENLLSNARVLVEFWRFTAQDVLLHALPIFHTHGLFVATNVALLSGASLIFLPKFDLDAVVEGLPQATVMMGVPTFYTRLLTDTRLSSDLTASMRLFISGSAPLLAETHRDWQARTGHRILERYGMTETNMSTSNPYDGVRKPGTVGPPLPGGELKVCDPDTGAELAQGEIGMIETRGPNVFGGYWQMPEKTAAELRADGFFITGDLGYIDPDGYVVIVGRGKDLIISGGFNIYPKELELILDDQPGVLESAVIGVPHPDFGETPVAVLVPQAGRAPDLTAITATLRDQVAGFKQPRKLLIRDALPRNTMGKVQKAALRAEFAGLFA